MLTPEEIASAAMARTASGWHLAELTEDHMALIVATAALAVKADRAQHRNPADNYEKGDPDDTPGDGCTDIHPGGMYYCTRAAGHKGNHAAGTGIRIARVWDLTLDSPLGGP